MTAAEKRTEFANRMAGLMMMGHDRSWAKLQADIMADLLTFTDDEPATPAQEPDWRDEVSGAWKKRDDGQVFRQANGMGVYVRASFAGGSSFSFGSNNDWWESNSAPAKLCAALDILASTMEEAS